MAAEELKLDLAATGLTPANFPARPWISGQIVMAGYSSETIPADGTNSTARTLNVYELRVPVVTGRTKRCFVMCRELNVDMKPVLVVGLPATPQSASADGCKELWRNTAGVPNIEFRWPAQVVRDQNCFAVVIDRAHGALNTGLEYDPNDGETVVDSNGHPYPGNAYDPLIEDVACIEAARYFINNAPMLKLHPDAKGVRFPLSDHMMIGGLSWGSLSASMLLAACPQFIAGYLAGMYLNSNWYSGNPAYQPSFDPTEWSSSGFNYDTAYIASKAREIVLSWGSADDAYVNYDKPYVDSTVSLLQSTQPGKFVKNISTAVPSHAVDLVHCRARFADWFNRMTNTSWSSAIPPL